VAVHVDGVSNPGTNAASTAVQSLTFFMLTPFL
jgi:hypothetical protein